MNKLSLSESFDVTSREDWAKQVERGLKTAGFDSLIKRTDDDLARGPLFSKQDRPETIEALPRIGAPLLDDRPWHMCSPLRDPDIGFANEQVIADLEGGASALDIELGDSAITLRSVSDLKRLLEGVWLDLVPFRFNISNDALPTVNLIKAYDPLAAAIVDLGLDSIHWYLSGVTDQPAKLDDALADLADNWTAISINAAAVHEMGGTEAQELSVMAASAAYYWRVYGPQTKLSVKLAADRDGHLGISKVRAARQIMMRIAEVFGAETNITFHSVSSLRMMQSIDPWTNLLRVMTAGFGAICGGADYVTLRPFTDAPSETPRLATPFGYRIARNMQLMMMEESHLGQVNDAAYGSYFHEAVTQKIAEAAWLEFQAIETGGGIDSVIASGILQDAIAAAKSDHVAKNEPILGVTLHQAENARPAKFREIAK